MRTAQLNALAAFLPWGGSKGAGRMTRCKDNHAFQFYNVLRKNFIIQEWMLLETGLLQTI